MLPHLDGPLIEHDLTLRPASAADAERLYMWRMDPETRAGSLNTAPIPFADHCAWLAQALADPNRHIYIVESLGVPVGTVRVDRVGEVCHLSWTVAPEFRGQRFGIRMVRAVAAGIAGPIEAVVKAVNLASIRIAQAAGMHLETTEDGVLRFVRGAM